jgi:hypothetical protein
MTTATMSKTWQHRVARGQTCLRRIGITVLVAGALVGFAAGVKVFCCPAHPDSADVAAIATRVDNQRAAAGEFAADFVAAYLTTRGPKRYELQRFISLPAPAEPHGTDGAGPAPVISTPKVWAVIPQGSAGDTDLYAATIVVQQRPYASADPVRAFYRVPVAIWNYQPRALDLPAPISDPGPGADLKTGYSHPLSPTSPLYAVVGGFVSTYLTGRTGLDRYVVAGSWITPVGGYQSAVITTAATATEVPNTPASGSLIHVRATVTAQTSQFATIDFTFPITVENSGGTWMISDIDLIPQISTEFDAAAAAPHS